MTSRCNEECYDVTFSGRGWHTRRGGRHPGHLVHAPPDDGHFAPQSPRPVHVEGSGVLREVSSSSPNRYQRRSPGYGAGTLLSLLVLHSSRLCFYLLIFASFLLFKDLLSHSCFMLLNHASLRRSPLICSLPFCWLIVSLSK